MTTLSDIDILSHINKGRLIQNADIKRIGPASYELRMGSTYYDLTESDSPINIKRNEFILIKPGHRVVLISHESIAVPDTMIARITSKGSLFSIGLSAVSTYADPGFSGQIGIVTQNVSDKYIRLPIGEPIAKIDFSYLSQPANSPYSGQHGYQTKIWPIRHDLQKNYDEIKDDLRVKSEELEAYAILPNSVGVALRDIQKKQRVINNALILTLALNCLLFGADYNNLIEVATSIITNLASSAVVGIIVWKSNRKGTDRGN